MVSLCIKGDFFDAMSFRYNWLSSRIPAVCTCGEGCLVSHALNCQIGGLPARRHNAVRNFTAEMMSEVFQNVTIEPSLQPLSGETLDLAAANREDNARVDISADQFLDW